MKRWTPHLIREDAAAALAQAKAHPAVTHDVCGDIILQAPLKAAKLALRLAARGTHGAETLHDT